MITGRMWELTVRIPLIGVLQKEYLSFLNSKNKHIPQVLGLQMFFHRNFHHMSKMFHIKPLVFFRDRLITIGGLMTSTKLKNPKAANRSFENYPHTNTYNDFKYSTRSFFSLSDRFKFLQEL